MGTIDLDPEGEGKHEEPGPKLITHTGHKKNHAK